LKIKIFNFTNYVKSLSFTVLNPAKNMLKNIKSHTLLYILLFSIVFSNAQNYADKNYYLVDSLELENLVSSEKNLIDSSLIEYHSSRKYNTKLEAINNIIEHSWDDGVWPKYNHWLYEYTTTKLADTLSNSLELQKLLLSYKSKALNNIGVIYNDKGDFSEALMFYYKSLKIREQIKDSTSLPESYNNIGSIYISLENFKKALEYNEKALSIATVTNNLQPKAIILSNIGGIYTKQGLYNKALLYFEKSIVINKQIQNNDGIANSLNHIGNLLEKQNKLNKGLDYLNEGLKLSERNNNLLEGIKSQTSIAKIYIKKKDANKSKIYAEKAFATAKKYGDPEYVMTTSLLLSTIYKNEGDWKKSFNMQQLYFTMKDSIQNNEVEQSLIKQKSKYDIEKKEQEIDILSANNEIQRLKISKNKYSMILICIALLLALVTAFVSFRGYRKKQLINRLLKIQKAEISEKNEAKKTMLQEIHHRVKNNLQVVNSLLRMQSSKLEDENIVDMFKQTQSRVSSMAKLHEKMYQSGDLEKLSAKEHLTMLVKEIVRNYSVDIPINLDLDIDVIFIDSRTMMPLSLIVNEIITNSLKYAFKGREEGLITVKLNKVNDVNELIISDDGVGYMPNDESAGLGSKLIQSFTRQLNGEIKLVINNGTIFKLTFKN